MVVDIIDFVRLHLEDNQKAKEDADLLVKIVQHVIQDGAPRDAVLRNVEESAIKSFCR